MMMAIVMLIYAVSSELQLPVCATIHNQCSNVKLASPVYFANGAVCPKLSDQQIGIDAKMSAGFEIYATRDDFEGALIYKLQRYVEPAIRHNMDTLAIDTGNNKTKCVQIFMAWKVKDAKPFVYAVLIEHTKELIWNEDKLKRLYYENHNRFKECDDTISDTWYMDDNMTLQTTFRVGDLKRTRELEISVSEEERDEYAMRPLCIDLER
jgi:hypothetical protein